MLCLQGATRSGAWRAALVNRCLTTLVFGTEYCCVEASVGGVAQLVTMSASGRDRDMEHRRVGDLAVVEREDSGRSSQLSGEFMQSDPKFESPPGSDTSDSVLTNLAPQSPLVTVVWRQLTVVSAPFM